MTETIVAQGGTSEDLAFVATKTFAWIVRIYRRANADQARFMSKQGLTPSQYGVLALLFQKDGVTFTDLAKRATRHGSTLTGIVDRLASKGLVVRTDDARDRRQIMIFLTDAGRALLHDLDVIDKDGLLCRALRGLTADERRSLLHLLSRLGHEIGEEDYDALVPRLFALLRAGGAEDL